MKSIFKLLSIIAISVSTLISLSSCGFKDSSEDSSSLSNQSNNITSQSTQESFNYPKLLDYDVIDLEKLNPSSYSSRKEYILNDPNQYFTLQLTLNNPDKCPIRGVSVSSIKHEGESLTCSLDYSKINIKIKANGDYGIQIYQIDKIFYETHNKQIFSEPSNKYFNLRVKSINPVTASDFSYTKTPHSLNVSFNINDVDYVTKNLPLKYKFIDSEANEESIVKSDLLKVGKNSLVFDDLKEYNNYELVIYYGRYLQDKNGSELFVDVGKFDLQTARAITVVNIDPSYEKVTFKVNNIDNVNITKMYLNNLTLDKKEQITTEVVEEFNNICSDTNYEVVIEFKYRDQEYVREFEFKTKAYVAPSFKFKNYDAKYQTISYEVEFDNPLNFGNFYEVELEGPNGKALKTLKGIFNNCVSGYKYKLILKYYYDLHDGRGNVNKQVIETIETKRLDISDISLDLALNGKNSIDYEIKCNNKEKVSVNSVELYLNNEVKETIDNKEFTGTFSNLINNQKYTVKAYYEVALEGETSTYKNSITSTINTRKLRVPQFDLKITPGLKDVSYKLVITDDDKVFRFYDVDLYKGKEYIDGSTRTQGTFSNLISGTKYIIRMTYILNYNDNNYPSSTTKDYEFETGKYTAPVFNISNVDIGVDYFSCDTSIEDPTGSLIPNSIEAFVNDKNLNHYNKTYEINDYKKIRLGGLYSCTSHTLIIRYQYNLNDGKGTQHGAFTYEFRTQEKIVVTKFKITPYNYNDPKNRYFEIYIAFINPSNFYFGSIVINGITLELNKIPTDEINLKVGDVFNYKPESRANTLDAMITTLDVSYEVYLKNPWA